ncbi:MAG: hypothetical protein ACK5V3_01920 [Bdellovibrionales bacterium]
MRLGLMVLLIALSQLSLAAQGFRCETSAADSIHFGASFIFSGEEGHSQIIQAQLNLKGYFQDRNEYQEFVGQGSFNNISSIAWTLQKKEIQLFINNNLNNSITQAEARLTFGSFSTGASAAQLELTVLGEKQKLRLNCYEQ